MKSITKSLLSEGQIKKLVKVNFGDTCKVGSVEELKGGMFNSAYLIERISEGDKIVLKVSVSEKTPILSYEKVTMFTEVEVYKMIAEKTTIPAPKLLAYDFSRKHIPCDYFFMTALTGKTMNKVKLSKENKDSIMRELADIFAQQHQIKGDYFGYFTGNKKEQYSTWREAFQHIMDMILSDAKSHGIKLPYDRYAKLLKEKAYCFDQIKEPILVNYDLHPGNIFLKEQGGRYVVEGVVDFERAFWGDPYADFPAAFLMTGDIRKEECFWKAYRELAKIDHDITKEEMMRILFYRLYMFTILQVEVYRYGFLYSKMQGFFGKKVANQCMDELEKL